MSDPVGPGIPKSGQRLLCWEEQLWFCCSIFAPCPDSVRSESPPSPKRGITRLPTSRFKDPPPTTSLSVASRDSPVVNLLKVIRFSFETSWCEIISDQAAPLRRYWIFVVCLRWMMHVCIRSPVLAALHASFLSFLFPCAVNRGFSKDFGKKGPAAMPSTPGGGSKVVPIASLNPYQSKWVWLQFVPKRSQI